MTYNDQFRQTLSNWYELNTCVYSFNWIIIGRSSEIEAKTALYSLAVDLIRIISHPISRHLFDAAN